MIGYGPSNERQPLFYARGHPVYVTTLLVASHVFALLVYLVFAFAGLAGALAAASAFSSFEAVRGLQLWRLVTYAFCHVPSIWFLLELYLLYQFGREIEQFLGRGGFLRLYAALLVVPPLLLCVTDFFGLHVQALGSADLHLALFVAFACLYPEVRMFLFDISVKWWATILVAFYALTAWAAHAYGELLLLLASCAVAVVGMRLAGAAGGAESLRFWRRWPALFPTRSRRLRPLARPKTGAPTVRSVGTAPGPKAAATPPSESIDPLLEKISQHGLASLSPGERAQLEKARASLLRKEQDR